MAPGEEIIDIGLRAEAGTLFMQSTIPSVLGTKLAGHIPLAVVTELALPDGTSYVNVDHSRDVARVDFNGQPANYQIPLAASKVSRLVDTFRGLSPGHTLDCHDFVDEVEGWEHDRSTLNCSQGLFNNAQIIEPGVPYAVLSRTGAANRFERIHSCYGTSGRSLLSILGRGSMLAVLDVDTTLGFYPTGRPAYFSRAYSPKEAREYPNGIVPAKISRPL